MLYRNLGNSGLKVSVIGLGTNQFGGKVDLTGTKNIISAAIDVGINFIDTADIYQAGRSEAYIGEALKDRRDQALIATKVFGKVGDGPNDQGASRKHIMDGVEASLRRLGTDYIDLYQIHVWDDNTPIDETMQALDDLIRDGRVRYIGASNFDAWQLTHANAVAELKGWAKFVSIQPHYHMMEREIEKELIPACHYFGIGILPYFPLAGGFLTGKYIEGQPAPEGSRGETSEYVQRYMTPENYSKLSDLTVFAKERDHTLNELAHAWLLSHPMVSSVISGATRTVHVQANAASGEWELTSDEIVAIREILDKA
jgi:aryl-alcohol dehydrogenase-like predicted oxidoreductase